MKRTVSKTAATPRRAAVLFLFFLSGCSGLIYEVVWVRQLTFIFGATQLAVSTVLGAFMGGLALGSWIGGRVVDRHSSPLKLYAGLEFGIAASALALLWLVYALDPVYSFIHRLTDAPYFPFSFVRFALNFVLLLAPTTLMGVTLPVLSRAVASETGSAGLWAGMLYALNTLGAVFGCLWAGFVGIAAFGITRTVLFAAVINVAVGVIAARMSRTGPGLPSPPPSLPAGKKPPATVPRYSPRALRVLLLSYGLSGMAAMGYQVLWTRTLVFTFRFSNCTTYSFTAMLAVFLIGLAAGSGIVSLASGRVRDPLKGFAVVQVLTGLSVFGSLYLSVNVVPSLMFPDFLDPATLRIDWLGNMLSIFVNACLVMLPSTVLIGMMFPLAVKSSVTGMQNLGSTVGRIYGSNTIGAILGSFATGFIVIPLFGLTKSMLLYAGVNVLIGTVLLLVLPGGAKRPLRFIAPACAVFAFFFLWNSGNVVFHRLPELDVSQLAEKLVFYKEGPLDTVSVYALDPNDKLLHVDGGGVAGTSRVMLTDQKTMAHLPMLLLDDPKTALAFGFGSGGTAWSFLQHDSLRRLDVVEISPTIFEAAPYLRESNNGLLDGPLDPRLNIIQEDARNYLRMRDVKYDIIEVDCTDLRYKTNANLYSVEFFDYCRKRLNRNGMVVAWFPIGMISETSLRAVFRTFHQVYPYLSLWYFNNHATHYVLLLGTLEPLTIDYQRFLGRLARPKVREDLAIVGLADPYKLLSCYVTDQDGLAPLMRGAPLNTEDRPYLEFHVPRDLTYADKSQKVRNLTMLMDMRKDVSPLLTGLSAAQEREFGRNIAGYYRALPFIIQGHNHRDLNDHEKAVQYYRKALSLNPTDVSLSEQFGGT